MRSSAVLAVLLAALAPLRAGAANLEVSPIRVELSARQPSALLTVKNGAATPARVQFRVQSWDESPAGQMLLSDSSEVQVFPALQQLAPGEERKVRLGTTAKPGAKERSWRLFIEELPSAVEAGDKNRVRILTRIGVPVFLAPLERRAASDMALAQEGGKLTLTLRNPGSVSFQVGEITVALLGEKDERLDVKALKGWYVLAGGERVFPVEVPAASCGKVRRAVATAAIDKVQLQRVLALPAGACAP